MFKKVIYFSFVFSTIQFADASLLRSGSAIVLDPDSNHVDFSWYSAGMLNQDKEIKSAQGASWNAEMSNGGEYSITTNSTDNNTYAEANLKATDEKKIVYSIGNTMGMITNNNISSRTEITCENGLAKPKIESNFIGEVTIQAATIQTIQITGEPNQKIVLDDQNTMIFNEQTEEISNNGRAAKIIAAPIAVYTSAHTGKHKRGSIGESRSEAICSKNKAIPITDVGIIAASSSETAYPASPKNTFEETYGSLSLNNRRDSGVIDYFGYINLIHSTPIKIKTQKGVTSSEASIALEKMNVGELIVEDLNIDLKISCRGKNPQYKNNNDYQASLNGEILNIPGDETNVEYTDPRNPDIQYTFNKETITLKGNSLHYEFIPITMKINNDWKSKTEFGRIEGLAVCTGK